MIRFDATLNIMKVDDSAAKTSKISFRLLEQCPQGSWGAVGGLLDPLHPPSEDKGTWPTNISDFTVSFTPTRVLIHPFTRGGDTLPCSDGAHTLASRCAR